MSHTLVLENLPAIKWSRVSMEYLVGLPGFVVVLRGM